MQPVVEQHFASDPAWKDDPAIKDWSAFMDKYYPDGDRADSNTVFGYAIAETLSQVLKQCGDDLSRENIMKALPIRPK